VLNRDEILKRVEDKPWVSPFEKIIGVYNAAEELVQLYEYHARNSCYGAAAWAVYHYKRTSSLVIDARRDGVRDIFTLKVGMSNLNLKPSISCAGIEAVDIIEDKIHVTYAGLAGGGVGSTLCRALANGVEGTIIHAEGGGDKLGRATLVLPKMIKLQVGVDDTDKPGAGATWSLANEIAVKLGIQNGIEYINHTLVQLFPGTPNKTTNCVATVLTFAVNPGKLESLQNELDQHFSQQTLSEHTGLAFWGGITIPRKLTEFSNNAKNRVVSIDEAVDVAKKLDITIRPKKGNRGCIGAIASIGYAENQDKAVKLE